MSVDPNLYWEAVLFIAMFLLFIGFATKLAVDSGDLKLPPKEKPAPKYALVECDCGANTPCPQGRESNANPYRCKVPKIVHEGVITRTHGALE